MYILHVSNKLLAINLLQIQKSSNTTKKGSAEIASLQKLKTT